MTYRYPPASTSLQGLIELAGDLDGYNSSASVPTIGSLTGDGYGIVSVIANTLRSISGNSSLTIGTNKSGANLILQADTASTIATLSSGLMSMGSSAITFGTNSASIGEIRAPNNTTIIALRNTTNTGDYNAVSSDSGGSIIFGDFVNATASLRSGGPITLYSSGITVGNTSGQTELTIGGSVSLPIIQSNTSATSLTLGTNKSGADLILQAGAASTAATLTSSGISVNSLAGFGDGYVVVDNSGNLSFSATAGGGGVSPGTPGQIFVTDGYSDAVFTSLISYDPTHGTITAGGSGSDFKTVIGPRVSNETVQSTIAFLAQATTPTANTWSVAGNGTDTLFGVQSGGTFYFEVPGVSVIATMEGTHGRLTSGGVGSDVAATIGPVAGFETTFGGIIFGNIVNKVGVLSDGTNTYLTALGGWDLEWQSGGNLYGVSGVNMSVGNSFSSGVLNLVANNTTAAILTAASSHALFTVGGNGSDYLTAIGPVVGSETSEAAFWALPHGTALSGTNWALASDGTNTTINGVSGNVNLISSGTTFLLQAVPASAINVFVPAINFDASVSNPAITQTQSTSGAGAQLSIIAQAAKSGSNDNGGALFLTSGALDGSGNQGAIHIGDDRSGIATIIGYNAGVGASTTELCGSPVVIQAYGGGGSLEIYATAMYFDWGGGLGGFATFDLNTMSFHNLATAPLIYQFACASDVAPVNLTITAQAPYASAATHVNAADVVVNIPASISGTGKVGGFQIQYGGTTAIDMGVRASSAVTPLIQSGSTATQFTIGTNQTVGTLIFQSGIAVNSMALTPSEIDFLIDGYTAYSLTQGASTNNLTLYDPSSHSNVGIISWETGNLTIGTSASGGILDLATDANLNVVQFNSPTNQIKGTWYDNTGTAQLTTFIDSSAQTVNWSVLSNWTANFYIHGTTAQWSFSSSSYNIGAAAWWFSLLQGGAGFGASNAVSASPVYIDWGAHAGTVTTPIISSGTSATSLTIGTNTTGGGGILTLQGDTAVTMLALSNSHGLLTSTGAWKKTQVTQNSNYTVDSGSTNDDQIWMSGPCDVTLPNPATLGAGRVLEIIVAYDPTSGGGHIKPHGAENINGSNTQITLSGSDKYSIVIVRTNGTDWIIKGGISI